MEKRIDLILDLKRNGFYQVRGAKQGDNFAYLYVTLTQNSVPMELDDVDIRINYKVPCGATYFQDSKTGVEVINNTVKIKVISNVLEESGVVQADISLFTKDTALKINSATFQMLVEPSIYTEDKLPKEYDALQKALVDAESLETTFNTATDLHNILTNDTKQGKELDSTLKQDIKEGTTLDNNLKATISTANSTKDNLEEVIKTADDKTYATKGELDETKMATEHIEGLGVVDLSGVEDGYLNIEKIEGNTLVNLLQKFTGTSHDITNKRWVLRYDAKINPSVDNLKPNTTYTFSNSKNKIINLALFAGSKYTRTVRGNKIVFTTSSIETGFDSVCYESDGWTSSEDCLDTNYMLIEGDWTNKSLIKYFEGIKSLDSCTIKSVGKNLFDGKWYQKYIEVSNGIIHEGLDPAFATSDFIFLQPQKDYTSTLMSAKTDDSSRSVIFYDKNKNYIATSWLFNDRTINTFTTPIGVSYAIFRYYQKDAKIDLSNLMLQLEEGTTATPDEEYKESKIDILNELKGDKSLKRLPNGVYDTLGSDGVVNRRIEKKLYDGTDSWSYDSTAISGNTIHFRSPRNFNIKKETNNSIIGNLLCDKFVPTFASYEWQNDVECIAINTEQYVNLRILKTKLTPYGFIDGNESTYVPAFKAWLKDNNVTVYYELAEPTTEKIDVLKPLRCFKGGHLIVESDIPVPLDIKYPTNFASRVKSTEEALNKTMESLGGVWRTLLILADRELRMKAIPVLSTTDDISKKINEILTVWR